MSSKLEELDWVKTKDGEWNELSRISSIACHCKEQRRGNVRSTCWDGTQMYSVEMRRMWDVHRWLHTRSL